MAKTEMQSSSAEKQPAVPPVQSSLPPTGQPAPIQAPPVYGKYQSPYGAQFPPQQNYSGAPGQPYAGQSPPGQPYAQLRQPAPLAPFQSYPPAQVYPGQPAYGYQPQYPMQRPYYPPQQGAPTGYPPQQLAPFSQQPTAPAQQPPQQRPFTQPPPQTQPFSQQPPPFSNQAQRPVAPPVVGNNLDRNGSNGVSDNMTEFLKNVGSARQLISAGNPAFAVEPLDTAVKLRPRNLSVYFYRGLAYDEAGDPSRAVKDYMESLERAKTVGMDSAELRTNLGNSYMKLNFVKDAIIEYQKAIQIDPGSGAAHLQLGRAQLMNGDYNEALKNLRRAESLGYSDASIPYLKALSLAALGAKEEARSELSALLSGDARDRSPQLHNLAQDLAKELK